MKARKVIYTIVGSIFILLNLIVDIAEFGTIRSPKEDGSYNFGYFIGSHILLIFGLILLRMAYKLHKKLKKKEMQEMIDSIGNSQ